MYKSLYPLVWGQRYREFSRVFENSRKFSKVIVQSLLVVGLMALLSAPDASAQVPLDSLRAPAAWRIDSAEVGQLDFRVQSTLFFRDNEFDTPLMRGYTLPGFRLRPSFSYRPNNWVNVDFGVYLLRFWGTNSYPNLSYSDIANWTGGEHVAKGFHMLPFFRVQMVTKGGLNFVLGSIYGAYHHRLLEPLYAPELNLIADPESGAQIIYSNNWLDFDTWVNWESFIYKGDTHQEAFTFGVSSRLKYNRKESPVHVYTPVQVLFQHRGGEIDTLYTNSVQTLFNGAVGIGTRIDINHRAIRSLTLEADLLAYNQQVGSIWPFDSGWASWIHAKLDVANVRAKCGWFSGHKFVSLFGYPFFGGISVSNPGLTFERTSLLMAGIDYSHEFAPGYTLGASAVFFRHLGATGIQDGVAKRYGPSLSYSGTLYVRLNPSFLIKKLIK